MLLITALANVFANNSPQEAYLLPVFEFSLDMMADKETTVKRAAQHSLDALMNAFPVDALTSNVLPVILEYLASGAKWGLSNRSHRTDIQVLRNNPIRRRY